MRTQSILFLIIFLGFLGSPLHAEIYTWHSVDGMPHATNDLDSIPPLYREIALENLKKRKDNPKSGYNTYVSDFDPEKELKKREKIKPQYKKDAHEYKDYWTKTIRETRKDLDEARRDLAEVRRKQIRNLNLRGPGMQEKMQKYAGAEKTLQRRVDFLEEQLYETIPDAARQAGVPPGWLREEGLNAY